MLIAIVVGALVGAMASGEGGALAGALFGWLVLRSLRQQREIEGLRQGLDRREPAPVAGIAPASFDTGAAEAVSSGVPSPAASSSTPGPATPATTSDPPSYVDTLPGAATARVAADSAELSASGSFAAPASASATGTASAIGTAAAPGAGSAGTWTAPPTSASRRDVLAPLKQWLFGGNTIVKAGVGILFVGLAFLAKYASEHVQLPVEVRLAAIAAAAVVLLAFGWRLRLRRPDYAQVLQGGAIAVLYLTLFAAFRYYGVLAAAPAFALMVAVAAFAAALAVLQDARALAVIGALGGFATPLLVSTGSDNHVALFTYYLVLDAGIAAVAWFKTWRSLNLLGFAATFIVATAWGVLRYRPESFASSQAFLIAFFLLFVLILVLPARRAAATGDPAAPRRSDAWVNSSLLFGLPTIVFALQYGLVRETEFGTALSALAFGGFYVLLAAWMRKRPQLGLTFDASLAIATIFLTLVIPFALDARSTAGAWTIEGAGLVWIGFRQRRGLPRVFGYLLLLLGGLAMLLARDRYGAPTQLLNAYLFNGVMAAAAAIAAAFFVHRHRAGDARVSGEEAAEPLLVGLATVWLASTAWLHIAALVPDRFTIAAILASASAVAVLYALLAARLDWPMIGWPTLAHAPLLLAIAALAAAVLASPLAGGGAWAWPLAFAGHAVVLHLVAPRWPTPFAHLAHATGAIAFALLGALLGRAVTEPWGQPASAWPWLGWLALPAALLLVLARPATARTWPVRALPAAYQQTTAAVLAAGLWLWTLVANVASDGSAAPLPHLPLLNPLDIGIGIALAATWLWLRRSPSVATWALAMGAAAGFVWLNAILIRAFHHYGGVPYRIDAWIESLAVQTGITLLWTTTALVAMWLAARRALRTPWIAGAALLGAVVIKLLLVDLSGSGTVTRIVSFIGVGVLMLVIGYVAPLPSREVRHATP
ncbi:MAG TPA: DUF2339 domain-containing protein [Caldimonas sp.]|jgi:uncharacterized membrane protein|nr:DUF2339 domain-containing protein [Caldimonas sp.]HEX2539614.1 DUF2339 domain-containing protein [Caldimonas sp.]